MPSWACRFGHVHSLSIKNPPAEKSAYSPSLHFTLLHVSFHQPGIGCLLIENSLFTVSTPTIIISFLIGLHLGLLRCLRRSPAANTRLLTRTGRASTRVDPVSPSSCAWCSSALHIYTRPKVTEPRFVLAMSDSEDDKPLKGMCAISIRYIDLPSLLLLGSRAYPDSTKSHSAEDGDLVKFAPRPHHIFTFTLH
nr:hypothetical protein CFP56_75921 [Quercus suber]